MAPDDRDRARPLVQRDLGAKRRLVIAARAQQQTKDRFHLTPRKAELLRPARPVLEQLPLALRIANPEAVLALVCRNFGDERHALRDDLEELAVERVDHGAEERKSARAFVGHA